MKQNFVWISDSTDALVNMARDEWMLDRVKEEELILHIYQNENAVIIGKNQNPWVECDTRAMEKEGVVLARRISGGGAVYHDLGNLNFSFICGKERFDKEFLLQLILDAVKKLGIPCETSGRNDLLAAGKKFSGTALCDRKGKKLFHGTLLIDSDLEALSRYLTVDPKKIQSKGISSVRSRVCNLVDFVPDLTVKGVQKALLSAFETLGYYGEFSLSAREREGLELEIERHRNPDWNFGATPRFDYEWRERVSFGSLQLCLSFEKGKISGVRAFSDAMDPTLCPEIEAILTGLAYENKAIREAFLSSSNEAVRCLAEYTIL